MRDLIAGRGPWKAQLSTPRLTIRCVYISSAPDRPQLVWCLGSTRSAKRHRPAARVQTAPAAAMSTLRGKLVHAFLPVLLCQAPVVIRTVFCHQLGVLLLHELDGQIFKLINPEDRQAIKYSIPATSWVVLKDRDAAKKKDFPTVSTRISAIGYTSFMEERRTKCGNSPCRVREGTGRTWMKPQRWKTGFLRARRSYYISRDDPQRPSRFPCGSGSMSC